MDPRHSDGRIEVALKQRGEPALDVDDDAFAGRDPRRAPLLRHNPARQDGDEAERPHLRSGALEPARLPDLVAPPEPRAARPVAMNNSLIATMMRKPK